MMIVGSIGENTIKQARKGTSMATKNCYICKGSGSVDCQSCRGRGQDKNGDDCISCDGKGTVDCYYCDGTGQIEDDDED